MGLHVTSSVERASVKKLGIPISASLCLQLLFCQLIYCEKCMAEDWFDTDKALSSDLEAKGVHQLALRFQDPSKLNAQSDLMKCFDFAVRTGNDKLALQSLTALSKNPPSQNNLSQMCDFLIGKELWELTQKFLEIYPNSQPGWGYIFVRNLVDRDGYSKTDSWLKSRLHDAQQVKGKDGLHHPFAERRTANQYWVSLRIEAASEANKLVSLRKEIEEQFKTRPNLEMLEAVVQTENQSNAQSLPDFVNKYFQPSSVFEAWKAAEIVSFKDPSVCAKFLERALSLKYTQHDDDQMKKLALHRAARLVDSNCSFERDLKNSCKQLLAQCYQKTNQSSKAQKLLLELSAEQKTQMPTFALTQHAGQIQANTVAKPLEEKIISAEKVNEMDPQYWLGRANYYIGRNDDLKSRDAFEKAMSLSKLPSMNPTDTEVCTRNIVLNEFARYFVKKNEAAKAEALYWKDFDDCGSLSYRSNILNSLWQFDSKLIKFNDERIWTFLKHSKKWDSLPERLLMTMSEQCPASEKDQFWKRLTSMAHDDAGRSLVVAWVMTRRGADKDALALLDFCIAHSSNDKEQLSNAQFTKMEACLELKDWKTAESLFPVAKVRLQPSELPEWISRICESAASVGAYDDSLRIWKSKDRIDRSYISPIKTLCKYPQMRSRLLAYYKDMESREPSASNLCKRALDSLKE